MSKKFSLKDNAIIIVIIICSVCAILIFYLFKVFIERSEEMIIRNNYKNILYTDLNNCDTYFDGCNVCFIRDGEIGGCTKKRCSLEMMDKPKCLKYKDPKNISEKKEIKDFYDCVSAGSPVMESYPRRCVYGKQVFEENIGNTLEKNDMVRLDSIKANDEIKSPLLVTGEARGTWFFEGSFPVLLTNWDGLIIAEGVAQAEGEWMTEDFVRFKAEVKFVKPDYKDNGLLILQKDNPSGDSELDDALEVPIIFK